MATELLELGRVRIDRLHERRPDLYNRHVFRHRRMGDVSVLPPPSPSSADADQSFSASDVHDTFSGVIKNDQDAQDILKFTLLIQSIRTKVAFLSDLWSRIKVNEGMVTALLSTDQGKEWVDALTKAESAFLSFSQPNNLSNIGMVRSVLDSDILPSKFGIGVVGTMPLFAVGLNDLEQSAVSTVSSLTPKTYNFGDLSQTSLHDDVVEFEALRTKLGSVYGLGDPIALALIWGSVVVVVAFVAAYIAKRYFDSLQIPPEILALLKNLDPKAAADLLKSWMNANHLLGDVIDILKWVFIGTGVLVVGGGLIYFLSSD